MSPEQVGEGEQGEFFEPARPDGRTADTAIPVSVLNYSTQRLLEDRVPQLWVRGEVVNWRAHASGHRYFRLRDEGGQVDCVMFQGDARRLPTDPDEGMEVAVFGQPTLYTQRGQFQVIVRELEASGDGLWRLAFERFRRQLQEEGLLDPARKRAIPAFPRCVAVVTSRDGAALHDVLNAFRRRAPWLDVLVVHCRVQGEGAALDIRDALARVGRLPAVDTVILTRGGGSMEDLWCFNEEASVRAVAECQIPIVCAIGHEVDVTLCELVADLRAQTPSVAAELAAPDRREVVSRLRGLSLGLGRGLRRRVERGRDRLLGVERLLPRILEGRLARARGRIAAVAGRLEALSPLSTLERGYAVALDAEGRALTRIGSFAPGEAFRLRLFDGVVGARVETVESADSSDDGTETHRE
ncbi:MAG: exodeoxyribonuclease VII large subunit [Gemmatimonadota bacterium]|nr:exodeoxyribonuclease VII large subunit [Gemmatimonadota bacterium]